MGKESKKQGVSVWLRPDTITRMDSLLTLDNCSSRSEFMEKAARFYIGYLTSEDVSEYLSQALVATIKGTMDENSNRQRALLFKLCVEVSQSQQKRDRVRPRNGGKGQLGQDHPRLSGLHAAGLPAHRRGPAG